MRCSQQIARLLAISPKFAGKRLQSTKPAWPPEHLRLKMEKFQRDDGIPVYLKGGPGDKLLLGASTLLIAYGMADGLYFLLNMAFAKKK